MQSIYTDKEKGPKMFQCRKEIISSAFDKDVEVITKEKALEVLKYQGQI